MLVTPYLAECNHAGGGHVADVRGPYKTITAKHTGCIVAPSLIQYHTEQTENVRASGLGAPIPTVDASNRYGLTCANLVKYYSGVVGEKMEEPLPTVTAIDHNAVCAAHVVKFKETTWEQPCRTNADRNGRRGPEKGLRRRNLRPLRHAALQGWPQRALVSLAPDPRLAEPLLRL